MPSVRVSVGRRLFTGWQSVTVSTTLGAVAATVQLAGASIDGRGLTGQEPIEVRIDEAPVFRGHLDSLELGVSGEETEFRASGRSLAADLVDSTVDPVTAPAALANDRVSSIINRLMLTIAPRVTLDSSRYLNPVRIPEFAPTPGETYWAAIERALRVDGTLATAGPRGEVRLIAPEQFGRLPILLRESENVLSMRVETNWAQRFNLTSALAQGDSAGAGWESSLEVMGEAVDEAVRPTRVSVVRVEGEASEAECRARAQWEATVRAARGTRVHVTVPGWTYDNTGTPYEVGMLAGTVLPSIGISGSLVIESVQLRHGNDGQTAQLSLIRRDAYRTKPRLAKADDPATDAFSGGAA